MKDSLLTAMFKTYSLKKREKSSLKMVPFIKVSG